ncbi:Polyribonucleotide 5'-hydroxyl-kinase Clp1 [Porphyridium purpureum]|uniref:Protein CLP1 homolog n=1 Tax=Porphyridium purpureum TaxID=35688 RepID=A0A5J4YSA3_PORPP|nr:Polyribonucleotide 5'-hydroxyl-kinase Clp1 [Porphyridium purpureum]|eukprot:POR1382..scf236_6
MGAEDEVETFELEEGEELRFEVGASASVELQVTSGYAEVFGVELAQNRRYVFRNAKLALFTWKGCSVTLTGGTEVSYKVAETPMAIYVNAHSVLQSKRKLAKELKMKGPRCIVVGPSSCGKTSLSAILLAYMLKENHSAFFVEADYSEGVLGTPGSIGACAVEHIDVEQGPLFERPICFYYGHLDPSENTECLMQLYSVLGASIDALFGQHDELERRGFVANGPATTIEKGFDVLKHAITALRIDTVLVMDAERLYASLVREFKTDKNVQCVHVPKSGGVVTREDAFIRKFRNDRIKRYFYGPENELHPFTCVLGFDQFKVLRVGDSYQTPDSALPIGVVSTLNPLELEAVSPSATLIHSVLGVSQATDEADVMSKPVFGFCHVTKVDVPKRQMTVLAPSPGKLPGFFLVLGGVKWLEG